MASPSPSAPPLPFPDVITQSFQVVDRDQSGSINELELQEALSLHYPRFSFQTIQLLMFLFKFDKETKLIGLFEYVALWECLRNWHATFQRFGTAGLLDIRNLGEALNSLGYAVPSSVIKVLISKYNNKSCHHQGKLDFDSFVQCGMLLKGLTEKYMGKDNFGMGLVTLTYDEFMSIILAFPLL